MRLIDADAFRQQGAAETVRQGLNVEKIALLLMLIDMQPTVDAVEVVRCKDCINRHTCDCPLSYAVDWGIGNELPSDDDYCSCGERKEPDHAETD